MTGRYDGPSRTITYSCGHKDTIRHDSTIGTIIQAIGGPCPTCSFQEADLSRLLEPPPAKLERRTAKARRKKA